MLKTTKSFVSRLHKDDEGMETIQIVMILAVAAMVCLGVTKITGVTTAGAAEDKGIMSGVMALVKELIPAANAFSN